MLQHVQIRIQRIKINQRQELYNLLKERLRYHQILKIVDISGSSEELLLAGYKPVATANVDSYETDKLPSYIREELKGVKIVGHSMMDTMDMEAILEVNPDLIIMSQRQEKYMTN